MEPIYAYHITDISNIKPIFIDGLIPSIGTNSKQVHEHNFLVFFTTLNCIDQWIKRFKLDKNRIVVLKFKCLNYNKRYDNENDCFTWETVSSDKISVVESNEVSLKEYYNKKKKKIELEFIKSIINDIKFLNERLDQIESKNLIAETGWNYNETEPNIVKTVELLKKIRYVGDKSEYKELINIIRAKTLKKLVANDLGITKDCELYKSLNYIFADFLSNNNKIDITSLNYITQILSVNMFYRQLDRYRRTKKRYGDDNTIWSFDRLYLEKIESVLQNVIFKSLLDETIFLCKESQNEKRIN